MCHKIQTKNSLLKNFNLPSFLEDLNTAVFYLDFHNQNNSDINITCNNFIFMFNNILDQHAPLRFASRKETRSFHKPWLTKCLLTSISKKHALYKKMLSINNSSISAKYKFYRNKITHLKESLKQNYYRSKFENCRNCSTYASATATCEQSRSKQGEGKDQASNTYKWLPCTWK